jgi:hypothetical protein
LLNGRPALPFFSVGRRETVMSSDDRSNRARASNLLKKRIEINHGYSSTDFDAWLLERLAQIGRACARRRLTGAQSIASVSSLDISAASIATPQSKIPAGSHVQAVASDMADLARVIADTSRPDSTRWLIPVMRCITATSNSMSWM